MDQYLGTAAMARFDGASSKRGSVFGRWLTAIAIVSPLVICLIISSLFLIWFGFSTARILEEGELRNQSANISLLASYMQHLIDDMYANAGELAEAVARKPPTQGDLLAFRTGARSVSHLRTIAVFDAAGTLIAGTGDVPGSVMAKLPALAARLNHGHLAHDRDTAFLPQPAEEGTATDIPDLLFAEHLPNVGVNVVFDVAIGFAGRAANLTTSDIDAQFALIDQATMSAVEFGRGTPPNNGVSGGMNNPMDIFAGMLSDGVGADQARCDGVFLSDRRCIAFHRMANSTVVLAGLVDSGVLRHRWVRQSRPMWLFAAFVLAGGVVSSFLIAVWAYQRHADRERLAAMLDEVKAAYAAKSNFMAHLTHEFFTPLNSIIGFSELMHAATFGPLGEPYAGYVEGIHASAIHLRSITSDIMDAERFERGKFTLAEGAADLNAVTADAARMMAVFAGKHGVAIDVMPWLRPAMVKMDANRAMQVALNLISNAVKYSEPGDRVRVSVESRDGGFALTVVDQGIGMTREEIAGTELPFGAQPRASRRDSIGLGLPIVRGLMAAAGGRLIIASEKNKGTTVSAMFGA